MTRPNRKRPTKRSHEALMETVHATMPKPLEDPRAVVLSARCRHLGKRDTKANRISASMWMLGDPSGLAIAADARDDNEADKLWELFKDYDGAHDAHHRRVIGRPRFPNVAKLEYLPESEPSEEEAATPTDARTPEEKDIAAAQRWHSHCAILYKLNRHEREAIMGAMFQRDVLTKGARCTTAGRQFVMALRVLRDVADKR